MTGLRPHTKSFSQEARDALGVAVGRAREAAGYASRPAFSKASGVGKTSIWKLETGVPVSASVYEAAARAIPGWTEDTPLSILAGKEPPSTDDVTRTATDAARRPVEDILPPDWTEEDERRFQLAKSIFNDLGLPMKATALRIMKDEYDRLEAEQVAERNTAGQVTPGERS